MNFLIDFHGVLTDGSMSIAHNGEYLFDHIHTRDVRAIRELIARGYVVTILTASSNPVLRAFATRVQADLVVARDKSKLLNQYYPYLAIGDDAWDVQMLEEAERAFCPADADSSVLRIEGVEVLGTEGGRGCIAELVGKLCLDAAKILVA